MAPLPLVMMASDQVASCDVSDEMTARRLPHVFLAVYLSLCFLSLVWPGAALAGGRIEPYVLGLPFSLAWYAGWSLATFLALAIYHRATAGGRE